MSPATAPAAVGTIIMDAEELAALPLQSVIMADPGGQDPREDERRLVLQRRSDFGSEPAWYAAKGSAISAPGPDGNQDRKHYGPFLVIWLPPAAPAVESTGPAT